MRVVQVNLHHSRAASAVLCKVMENCDIALIQEPWVNQGTIKGLSGVGGAIIYCRDTDRPRACILIKNNIRILPLTNFCFRDLVAVRLTTTEASGPKNIVIGSAYFPHDDPDSPPPSAVEELVRACRGSGSQLIIGCDANAHHSIWGSTDTNQRGEYILQFLMANNLDIMNRGNNPTFVTGQRQEVLDITITTSYVGNFIKNWHVSEEESCSDHRHIRFEITCIKREITTYRDPRRTNWGNYRIDLERNLGGLKNAINNVTDLELVADQLTDAANSAYEANCPQTKTNSSRKVPWWGPDLETKRGQVRKNWNQAKRSGNWDSYRASLTEYNTELRKAKRASWRRHCEAIESTPECARLKRILSKDTQPAINSLVTETGEQTTTGIDTLTELFRVHFPGSKTIKESPVAWRLRGPEEAPNRASRANWQAAKKVISPERIRWAINSFEPYKSPGSDGICPAMLQQGSDLLISKLCLILRASLALGHIPKIWRLTKVVFIPKHGRPNYSVAKAFRPISLMSFILKTLEKLLDRHIRDDVMADRPFHQDQHAYRSGRSTESALHQLVSRVENTIKNREVLLGAFLDIEGAFDNTSFTAITRATRNIGLDETCCRWIDSMLKSRVIFSDLLGETLAARVAGGCPQGGVLSPLLWNLVMDGLLRELSQRGFSALGYADDLVIMTQGKFNTTVRDCMQSALRLVETWVRQEGLNISPQKIVIVLFTKRRKKEGLGPLILRGAIIPLQEEIKYLGVTLDSKLTWNRHVEKTIRKSEITLAVVRRMYGKTWGLSPRMMYWLYTSVVKPAITYAALVWWTKATQKTIMLRLNSLQRLACLGITGAMKSTPQRWRIL